MIPILYSSTEQIGTNGLGRLSDCISCEVTEERNGVFEVVFTYPITGIHYTDIDTGKIIYVTHDASKNPQPFVIYKQSKAINGIVTYNAHHISYGLNELVTLPSSEDLPETITGTALDVITALDERSVDYNPFEIYSDLTDVKTFVLKKPETLKRLIVGTTQESVIGLFGGEIEYDNYTVNIWQARGEDRGVTIRYGKDLTGLNYESNLENTYAGIVPYWKDSSTIVILSEIYIIAEGAPTGDLRLTPVDLTSSFQAQPTESELRDAAEAYLANHPYPWIGSLNITVNFELLKQSPEYTGITALNDILLCDIVSVYFRALDVYVQEKVVKTVYDPLNEKYVSIELGALQTTLADVITTRVENDLSN